MAYRFQRSESFKAGVRRILKEQVAKAHGQLSSAKDRIVVVHEARKCIKRIRALLRLVQPSLDRQVYKTENVRYRDIGRLLSASRDRTVMLETVSKLSGSPDAVFEFALAKVRKVLAETNNETGTFEDHAALIEAVRQLETAQASLGSVSPNFSGFEVIRFGLEKSYRRGQRELACLDHDSGDEPFHHWRKLVQIHWRHFAVLSEAWPDYFKSRVNLARKISQQVGEHNDLAVLSSFIDRADRNVVSDIDSSVLQNVIVARKEGLRRQARASGKLLFAEDAAALSEIVSRYWMIAREKSKSGKRPKLVADRASKHTIVPIKQRRVQN